MAYYVISNRLLTRGNVFNVEAGDVLKEEKGVIKIINDEETALNLAQEDNTYAYEMGVAYADSWLCLRRKPGTSLEIPIDTFLEWDEDNVSFGEAPWNLRIDLPEEWTDKLRFSIKKYEEEWSKDKVSSKDGYMLITKYSDMTEKGTIIADYSFYDKRGEFEFTDAKLEFKVKSLASRFDDLVAAVDSGDYVIHDVV